MVVGRRLHYMVEENQDQCAAFQGSWSEERMICVFASQADESPEDTVARYEGYVEATRISTGGPSVDHLG